MEACKEQEGKEETALRLNIVRFWQDIASEPLSTQILEDRSEDPL